MLSHFADDADMEKVMVDSTVICAIRALAGRSKNGGQAAQGLGVCVVGLQPKSM